MHPNVELLSDVPIFIQYKKLSNLVSVVCSVDTLLSKIRITIDTLLQSVLKWLQVIKRR